MRATLEGFLKPQISEEASPEDYILGSETFTFRLNLIDTARSDDLPALQSLLTQLEQKQISLCHKEVRMSENQATVLHLALENDSMKVAEFLIRNCEEKLLFEEYEVSVRGTPSKKTVLHLLCEKGNLQIITLMLDRIKPGKAKEAFLRKTVLTQIQGQRPRHLSSIHIAAIKGCTELVEYLVHIGIDVNLTNNKGDTPVLWAARWNHLQTARSLIYLGANLQHQNDKGSSPLYWAVRYGFEDMVELLINEGKADVHQERTMGLRSPIVLAATLGYATITEILLKNGANANIKIGGGFTPLHYAAMEGNKETLSVLIRYGAEPDILNDAGDSPLLAAAKSKESAMVDLLAQNGANLELRNKEGQTVWDYAIASPSTRFLTEIVNIYKRVKGVKDSKLTFGSGKPPLHKAALKDDCEKLECLFSLGADPGVTDEGKNTFFHLAARENSLQVLVMFHEKVDVNVQNDDGDTALHLATRYGHMDAVNVLLKRSKVGLANEDGDTALHTACKSRFASKELVHVMMDTIAKAHNWSLVASPDNHGNTALHVAAKSGRSEIFRELKQISPHIKNKQGDYAQHVVVRMGQSDVVEEFLNVFRQEMCTDKPNEDGDTVLHIAVRLGSPDIIELLIDAGADLTAKNKNGNTPTHELVLKAASDKENITDHLSTLDAIRDNVIYWWCMRHDQHPPDEDSDLYLDLKRQSYILITSEICNEDGFTVLSLAAKCGMKAIFERILQTPDVYMFSEEKDVVTFDVTKLTNDTVKTFKKKKPSSTAHVGPKPAPVQSKKYKIYNKVHVSDVDIEDKPTKKIAVQSCLALIVRSTNIRDANDMLDVIPLKQMVSDYWAPYKWLYGSLMVLHIIYMSLLSVYGVPLIYNSLREINYVPSGFPAGFLLLWPVLLFLHAIFIAISGIYRKVRRIQETEPALDNIRDVYTGVTFVFHACFSILAYYLANITQVLFSTLVIAWYVLYLLQITQMAHVMAAALIFGWLFTIVFTPGFEAVHSYSIMIKSIVLKDISRFMFLYAFVLMAFTFAIQCLIYLAPEDVLGEYPTTADIMFAVFNMMIGMYDPFSESIEGGVDKYGQAAVWIKLTYLMYIILTSIILLNLLIAMMTDSYVDVKANEGSTWRVSSVAMALNIDTTVPTLPKMLRHLGARKYIPKFDEGTKRWMMTIPKSALDMDKRVTMDKTTKALAQLNRDVNRLHTLYSTIDVKIDSLVTAVGQLRTGTNIDESATPRLRNRRGTSYSRLRNMLNTRMTSIRETRDSVI